MISYTITCISFHSVIDGNSLISIYKFGFMKEGNMTQFLRKTLIFYEL